jgi:hypothetical protein
MKVLLLFAGNRGTLPGYRIGAGLKQYNITPEASSNRPLGGLIAWIGVMKPVGASGYTDLRTHHPRLPHQLTPW